MNVATAPPRAGVQGSLLGMILFVSSEVMFFGGLFATWFTLRAARRPWPPDETELELVLPALLTVVLVASSVVVHRAVAALQAGDAGRAAGLLLAGMLLGVAFLTGQAYEYSTLGFRLSDGAFGTIFYALTGFHGLHVLIGVVILGVAGVQLRRGRAHPARRGDVEAAALYWHFVDAVWLAVFGTIYLIG
ncbi:MAG: cytochrome c oxidase subunit 3 [Actinomycetota bacterium]